MTYEPHDPNQPPVTPGSPAPYGQQPYPVQPYPPHIIVAASPPTSAFAVTALVFGILGVAGGFCFFGIPCIVAVICGHAGLIDTKNGAKGGHGMAVAGLILGYLFIAPAIILLVTGGIGSVFDIVTPNPAVTP